MSKKFIIITLGVIIICIIGIATILIVKFYEKDDDSKDIKERTSYCEMEIPENNLLPLEIEESSKERRLNTIEFKPLKIYIDLSYMNYQASLDINLSKNYNKVINSMIKAKTTLENIFNVVPPYCPNGYWFF